MLLTLKSRQSTGCHRLSLACLIPWRYEHLCSRDLLPSVSLSLALSALLGSEHRGLQLCSGYVGDCAYRIFHVRAVTATPDTVLAGGDGGVQAEHWEPEVRWDVQSSSR